MSFTDLKTADVAPPRRRSQRHCSLPLTHRIPFLPPPLPTATVAVFHDAMTWRAERGTSTLYAELHPFAPPTGRQQVSRAHFYGGCKRPKYSRAAPILCTSHPSLLIPNCNYRGTNQLVCNVSSWFARAAGTQMAALPKMGRRFSSSGSGRPTWRGSRGNPRCSI